MFVSLLIFQTPEPMYTEGDVKALKEQHAVEIQYMETKEPRNTMQT